MRDTAIKIEYWAIQKNENSIYDLEGISEFKNELDDYYVSNTRGLPGDLGGGLYELTVEFISNIAFSDIVKFLLEGIAFDLLKSGTKSFVLKPFLEAYKKLKFKNKLKEPIDLYQLNFCFNDTKIIVYNLYKNSIEEVIESVFIQLAKNYNQMMLINTEYPTEIHIPVLHDKTMDKYSTRFRIKLDVDETIENIERSNYFEYWGVSYYYSRKYLVYNLNDQMILNESFLDENMYENEYARINN